MSDTGSPKERELRGNLNEQDNIFCIRMAASGGGTSEALPDIHYWLQAKNGGIVQVAGEMKYAGSGNEYAYITSEEMYKLRNYCELTGAIPVAINRWARDTNFYVIPLQSVSSDMLTNSGNLSMMKNNRDQYTEISQYNKILERSK